MRQLQLARYMWFRNGPQKSMWMHSQGFEGYCHECELCFSGSFLFKWQGSQDLTKFFDIFINFGPPNIESSKILCLWNAHMLQNAVASTGSEVTNFRWIQFYTKTRVKVPVGTHGPMGTHLLKKNLPTVIGKANVSLLCLKKNFEHAYISYINSNN